WVRVKDKKGCKKCPGVSTVYNGQCAWQQKRVQKRVLSLSPDVMWTDGLDTRVTSVNTAVTDFKLPCSLSVCPAAAVWIVCIVLIQFQLIQLIQLISINSL